MSEFITIKEAVQKQLAVMEKHQLFEVAVDKQVLWENYLLAFPAGTNPMYKERTEHDCNCCRQFIKRIGNVVAVIDGELVSIWDVKVDNFFQVVADSMSKLVKRHDISDVFYNDVKQVGTDYNHQMVEDGSPIKWEHFHYTMDKKFVLSADSIPSKLSDLRANKDVLKRGLDEITLDAIDTVIELISQGSLYRGEEHAKVLKSFKQVKVSYDKLEANQRDNFCWVKSIELAAAGRIRNTVIGTLLVDISENVDLDVAVKKYEVKVAPANYKRPTALITKGMIDKAQKKVVELGLGSALKRRYAVADDLTINNVLFADRSVKAALDVFDELTATIPVNTKKFAKVEEMSIDKFMSGVLPTADTIEVLFENKHRKNMVSLIAPVDTEVRPMFKWGNNFSWSYDGEVADSLREQVSAKGGRVDGVLRFSHTWNYDGNNQSLMDLHVFLPAHVGQHTESNVHDKYGNNERVGWNNRKHNGSGGVQDVDFTEPPNNEVPVENITFPSMAKLKDGKYIFRIHNWRFRDRTTSGFKAEIECNGEVFEYEYPKALKNNEWVTVAEATLKNGHFTMNHKLDAGTSVSNKWNINTNNFHKVKMIMNSPNHWDGEETGNKHLFFMLDGCYNDDQSRGFYNEFLRGDLTEHRKVFEVLGGKMKTEISKDQLSGLGFSSTQRNSVTLRVSGKTNRTIKVNF